MSMADALRLHRLEADIATLRRRVDALAALIEGAGDPRICGAKTRGGTRCRRRDLGAGGRCRLHGGKSTGPRAVDGKRRTAANLPHGVCATVATGDAVGGPIG